MLSVSYQRKVNDYFFPELLVAYTFTLNFNLKVEICSALTKCDSSLVTSLMVRSNGYS
jgi:hypothetical protein